MTNVPTNPDDQQAPSEPSADPGTPPLTPIALPDGGEMFDVGFVFRALLRGWWVLMLAAIAGSWFGAQNLLNFGPVYVASMTVAPAVTQTTSTSSTLRSLGEGLGLNLGDGGGGPATTFDRLEVTISSLEFVQHLEEEYDIIRTTFAGGWDSQTQSWIKPSGRRFEFEQGIRERLHLPTWSAPTTQSFAEFLSGAIAIRKETGSPFTTVSTRSADPVFALWLLDTVYREADAFVREADLRATRQRKAYLEEQIRETAVLEFREMFVGLLANEERRLMLTQTDLPYAAQVIEQPFVSSQPTSPNLVQDFWVLVFGWILGGSLLVLLVALIRSGSRR
ncbi:MAG: hypothetical protein HOB82_01645 [Alphaproteobacteria bacterium]|jgi:hypothetical protein|nr:hypothetical protein [Alphaproteobacteria bacterium]MBT4710216.1 hypothetical protein [Alphaproteobacteria bacterium]MBT5860478.1 hypothetical protein [Alphaproteobacteria bacterium]